MPIDFAEECILSGRWWVFMSLYLLYRWCVPTYRPVWPSASLSRRSYSSTTRAFATERWITRVTICILACERPSSALQVPRPLRRHPRPTHRSRTRSRQQLPGPASQSQPQLPALWATEVAPRLRPHPYPTSHPDRTWLDYSMNYKDQAQIERMLANSNVVVNLLGPRHKIKRREDF
jgi:hypothetical protein